MGSSVEGREIECFVFGEGPDCTFILATIHGDEDAGTPLVRKLADHLSDQPSLLAGRRVVLMPVANPDGFAHQTRTNTHGVDLNRNYPASNYRSGTKHGESALSEPESAAIHRVLDQFQPRRIVSIHQVLRSGGPCIDHDGPAGRLAAAMAAHCDLPVNKLGGRSGSLGSYAGETLSIPIITFELPKTAKGLGGEALWRSYGEALLAAIAYPRPLHATATDLVD